MSPKARNLLNLVNKQVSFNNSSFFFKKLKSQGIIYLISKHKYYRVKHVCLLSIILISAIY